MFKNCMILAVLVVLLGLPQLSQAMCAYNRSDHVMTVTLQCGTFCENNWSIQPGDSECRPDKGGDVYYYFHGEGQGYIAQVTVEKHGWTTTRMNHADQLELCSKSQNASIKECAAFR